MKNKLRNFLRKRILPLALGSAMSFGMSAYFPTGDVVSAEETDLSMVTVTQTESGEKFMSNGYIGIEYSDNGQFRIKTTGGDPDNPDDDNKRLLFGPASGNGSSFFSSYTTVSVDGMRDVFSTDSNNNISMFKPESLYMKAAGNTQFYPEKGKIVTPVYVYYNAGVSPRTGKIETGDPLLLVEQILSIVQNPNTGREDHVAIEYRVENISDESKSVGLRVMFDTMNDENDKCLFRVPGYGDVDNETEFIGEEIPEYWQTFDDRADPSLISTGNLGCDEMRPDKVQFCNWAGRTVGREYHKGAYECKWDHQINPERMIGDSAVTLTWEEKILEGGESISFITSYGLDNALDLYVENDYYQEVELDPVLNSYTGSITATISNYTEYTVEDIELSLIIPDTPAMSLFDDATVKIESIPPHQKLIYTWNFEITGEGRFDYDVLLKSSDPHTNKLDYHIIEAHKKELNPLDLTVYAPETLSPVLLNTYIGVINATVTNDNDYAAEDIEVSLNLPGALLMNSDHGKTVNIESIEPHQSQEISWTISLTGTNEYDYTVSVKSSNPPTDKIVSKVIKAQPSTPDPIPSLIPDNPTDTPEPEPTYTPDPVPTETPEPEPTYTPDPVPTETPEPEPTYTPDPVPTETPEPEPTSTPELKPLALTVNAPDTISPLMFNFYDVVINATVTNDNDYAAEDIEVSLNFPASIINSNFEETMNIESIGPHQSQEISWTIVFAGTEEYEYTVSLKSSNPLTDKSVSKVMKTLPETPNPIPTFFPPTLIPNPTETPEPEPTNTSDPVPTDTPEPEPTNTPDPVPTETPEPEPTNTPDPVPTDTPEPTNTPDPVPTETPEPEPTNTPDPVPTETPEPEPTTTPEPQPTEHPSYVLYSGSETEDFSLYCWKSTFNGDVYTGRNFVCGASELYLNGRLDTVNNVTANGWQINIDEKNENTARVDMPDWGSNILANAGNIEQFDQDVVMIEDKNIVNGSISTSGNVVINGTTFEGDCFIIADGDITYNVSDFTSTGRVVLYSRNGNVTINGNTCDLNGIIYAPNGKVSFNTNVTNINGRVFADRISFSGSVFNVTGNDYDFELID